MKASTADIWRTDIPVFDKDVNQAIDIGAEEPHLANELRGGKENQAVTVQRMGNDSEPKRVDKKKQQSRVFGSKKHTAIELETAAGNVNYNVVDETTRDIFSHFSRHKNVYNQKDFPFMLREENKSKLLKDIRQMILTKKIKKPKIEVQREVTVNYFH